MRAHLVNEGYGQKDLVRMQDIKTKAAGDHNKELRLASTQANIIKNAAKAKARAEAAEEVFGSGSDIANIFHNRAEELGGSYVRSEASRGALAPVKGPKEKGKKLEREFEKDFFLPSEKIDGLVLATDGGSFNKEADFRKKLGIGKYFDPPEIGGEYLVSGYIASLGKVDLGSGKSKWFNIHDTYDGTAEIWKSSGYEGKYKIVFTSGDKPNAKIKDIRDFYNDQNHRHLGRWELVDYVPVNKMKELIRVYGGSLPGYTYK